MTSPTFSVVINNYNYRPFITEAIESALAQSLAPIEVIAVDDGSDDGSADHVEREFGARVRLVRSENRGQLSAFALGVAAASGDYVAFLDADDAWKPDHLARVATVLSLKPTLDFVMTNSECVGLVSGYWSEKPQDQDYGVTALAAVAHEWIGAPTSCLVIRRDLARRILDLPAAVFPEWRIRADDVLVYGGSIFGGLKYRIAASTVLYRIHGSNRYFGFEKSYENTILHRRKVAALVDILKARSPLPLTSITYAINQELANRTDLTRKQRMKYARRALRSDEPLGQRLDTALRCIFNIGIRTT